MLDFRAISGDDGNALDAMMAFSQTYERRLSESLAPDQGVSVTSDYLPNFAGLMQNLAEAGIRPFALTPLALEGAVAGPQEGRTVRLQLAPKGARGPVSALVLRRSDRGRWRVLGLEGTDLPRTWLYAPYEPD